MRIGVSVALLCSTWVLAAPGESCPRCPWASFWTIPPAAGDCKPAAEPVPCFPETDAVARRLDLGLAFSGGGTRSATLTLGQLRGLQRLGLLDKARYLSAVSGGAWAAVPFTYAKSLPDDFLGPYQAPHELQRATVIAVANGQLAQAIADSSLVAGSIPEVVGDLLAAGVSKSPSQLLQTLVSSVNGALRRESDRLNKTYTRLLGRVFIDPLVEPGTSASGRLFTWDGDTLGQISAQTNGAVDQNMVVVGSERPFLIANGTVISARPDYEYPLLMPIEYTPLYVGVRQRFGLRFGGSYVSPWAYDSNGIGEVDGKNHRIQIQYDAKRRFTLADVVASVGAAPQLALMLGDFAPGALKTKIQRAAEVFPAFRLFAVNDDGRARTVLTEEIAHGDGGFSDNLGVLPLLARGVRNIMVFNNTNTELVENNDDLKSLFFPVGPPNGTGDKRHNVVFERANYTTVRDGLIARRTAHQEQVYCTQHWKVLPNEHYNVAGFDGLNACWFYNSSAKEWFDDLPHALSEMAGGHDQTDAGKNFDHFPWFGTFGQNKTHVIQLTIPQVNLLSNLAAWIVANDHSKQLIACSLSGVLLPRPPDCPADPTAKP